MGGRHSWSLWHFCTECWSIWTKVKRQHYNRFISGSLEYGDQVLKEKGGPGKLRSFWKIKVSVVLRRIKKYLSSIWSTNSRWSNQIRSYTVICSCSAMVFFRPSGQHFLFIFCFTGFFKNWVRGDEIKKMRNCVQKFNVYLDVQQSLIR